MLATRAADNELFVAYVNMVGGQDELVFDGASVVFDPAGEPVARAGQFEEELLVVDLDVEAVFRARLRDTRPRKQKTAVLDEVGTPEVVPVSDYADASRTQVEHTEPVRYEGNGEVYAALVTATRDYVGKCGFSKVLVALSGGIDSSLVATIAVDALGADNVVCIAMPSRYSSKGSLFDSMALAENLGIELQKIPIEDTFGASLDSLAHHFGDSIPGLAQENLQSRIRGLLIMALSNRPGWMVLTTGNKSEMAVGYATIYGDMAGGYAVIKDVPKTLVYRLARYRNSLDGEVIPESVLAKPPSAELRPDQKDQDSLPPYEVLDAILKAYVEEDRGFEEILGMGFDAEVVRRTITMVDRSEYKRRQAPPGIKITPRNFGRDRRMPIAHRYSPF
jgi:NAD+ synthase (glutamine-hydrolysing)